MSPFHITDFRDADFSRNNYTCKGNFIKLDQKSVKEGMEWLKK